MSDKIHRIPADKAMASFGTHKEFIDTLHGDGGAGEYASSDGDSWEIKVPEDMADEFHAFLTSAGISCLSC